MSTNQTNQPINTAPDVLLAERVEIQFRHALSNSGFPIVLQHFIDLLPPDLNHPSALIMRAFSAASDFDMTTTARWLARVDPKTLTVDRMAYYNLIVGYHALFTGEPAKAISPLRNALTYFRPSALFEHGCANVFLALALAYTSRRAEAIALLDMVILQTGAESPARTLLLTGLIAIQFIGGAIPAALATLERLFAYTDTPLWHFTGFVPVWFGWAHYIAGVIAYLRNEFDEAMAHWEWCISHTQVNPLTYHQALTGIARLKHRIKDTKGAANYHTAAVVYANTTRNELLALLSSTTALWVINADLRENFPTLDCSIFFWLECPPISIAAHHINRRNYAHAVAVADTAIEHANAAGNAIQLLRLHTLRAVALYRQRMEREAGASLEIALAIAANGDLVRPFLDYAADVLAMLRRTRVEKSTFAVALIPLLEQATTGNKPPVVVLTPRELELLAAIESMTVPEAAKALGMSLNTAKTHLKNIYAKLGVKHGRAALRLSRQNGWIP